MSPPDDYEVFWGDLAESADSIETDVDLTREDVDSPDPFSNNARTVNFSPAYPRAACAADVTSQDLPAAGGEYYHPGVSQVDGQYAWGSPVRWRERAPRCGAFI